MRRGLPIVLMAFLIGLQGCLGGAGTAPMVVQYTLEYPPPAIAGLQTLDESLKVARFAVAQVFNASSMFYRPEPFKLESYTYHRWRVTPGDLVTDFLLRDLRSAGLFKAVFSYRETENAGFALEGGVEEFLEVDQKDGPRAVISLNVTLLDLAQNEVTKRVVFQKGYRVEDPLSEKTAPALAQATSRAMAKLSPQVIRDVYDAILARRR